MRHFPQRFLCKAILKRKINKQRSVCTIKIQRCKIVDFVSIQRSDLAIRDQIGLLKYKANGINLGPFEVIPSLVSFKQIGGEMDFRDIGDIGLFVKGQFDSFELISGPQYIADLSGSEFDLDAHFHEYRSGLLVETDFGLSISVIHS